MGDSEEMTAIPGLDPEPFSDIRWSIQTILRPLAMGGTLVKSEENSRSFLLYTSNGNPKEFGEWTGGVTHESLLSEWKAADEARAKGEKKGYHTTCVDFLNHLITRLAEFGFVPTQRFQPFGLYNLPGWHWYGQPGGPRAGDLFQQGNVLKQVKGEKETYVVTATHVGVIWAINGANWVVLAGGQGGPKVGYDAIGRSEGLAPGKLAGWLNVDEYFVHAQPKPKARARGR